MKKFQRIYIEITNICNLDCSFCHGTKRSKKMMTAVEFSAFLDKIKGYTDLLFFHVMGEPLLNPDLAEMIKAADSDGFRVVITTNGTLLNKSKDILKENEPYRMNISLHAYEGNPGAMNFDEYINNCIDYAKNAGKTKVCFRLWNGEGDTGANSDIMDALHGAFPGEWNENRKGYCLSDGVYIEYADRFDWPDYSDEETGSDIFCYGLRNQLGILADGSVIPCCLDSEGELILGNLNVQSLEEILSSDRAKAIYNGFTNHKAVEELCRRCRVYQHMN